MAPTLATVSWSGRLPEKTREILNSHISVKDEMRRLLEKHPDGVAGFKGGAVKDVNPISSL